MTGRVDLNADLGESYGAWVLGDDAAVLASVTSANVACGFHAGDPSVLRATCTRAVAAGVVIGAQVGYPDLLGFGRRFIDMDPRELTDAVLYQVGALGAFARVAGARVTYVKPHGALYNAVVEHEAQAEAVVRAVREFDPDLPVLGLPGSALLRHAEEAGLRPVAEAFADRAYTPAGSLVPRTESGAVIHDEDAVVRRAVAMATEGRVHAVDGSAVTVAPESICVHGDTPGAVRLAEAVRRGLEDAGIVVAPFT
ncbi:MAG: 5-oxoprolinase subunit PxpA [Egicoccus sp.]